ncbi:hypothetical protein ACLOAV_009953 [Pseudogymnoascus australis]
MACKNLSREELGDILSKFLYSIDFYMPSFDYDFSLEETVMAHFEVQPWPEAHGKKAVKMAKWMSTGVGMCYSFADRESQVAYGIYAVYVLLIDDITRDLGSSMDCFATNLVLGIPQESAVLQSLVNWLGGSSTYQGPFATAMSIKSVIEFIRGCIMERDFDGNIVLPRGAITFPEYFRSKTGIAEPFTHFCFPEALYPESEYLHMYLPALQDICDYINYTNDILSLYKESVVGEERLTYILNYAHTHDLSLTDALRQVCENVVQNVLNIRTIFADSPQLQKTTEEFFRGYVAWYLNQARYRLGEIPIAKANGQQYKLTATTPSLKE